MQLSEITFIEMFLASLKKIGRNDFPFDNAAFYEGVDNMRQYFLTNKESFGKYANEIAMLFLKNPLRGKCLGFRDAIEEQNGELLAFDNPDYVNARMKFNIALAEKYLNQEEFNKDIIYQMAIKFCEGASITI